MSDTTDDLEMWSSGADEYEENVWKREKEWSSGFHTTRDGEQLKIREMETSHIKNCINYFEDDHDVSALKKELKRRLTHTKTKI